MVKYSLTSAHVGLNTQKNYENFIQPKSKFLFPFVRKLSNLYANIQFITLTSWKVGLYIFCPFYMPWKWNWIIIFYLSNPSLMTKKILKKVSHNYVTMTQKKWVSIKYFHCHPHICVHQDENGKEAIEKRYRICWNCPLQIYKKYLSLSTAESTSFFIISIGITTTNDTGSGELLEWNKKGGKKVSF